MIIVRKFFYCYILIYLGVVDLGNYNYCMCVFKGLCFVMCGYFYFY